MSETMIDVSTPTSTRAAGADSADAATAPQPMSALVDVVRQLAAAQQELVTALRGSAGASPTASNAVPAQRPATAHGPDEVRRIVGEVLAERDASARRAAARDRYVRAHMADLPDAYRRLVPDFDDDRALAAAEQQVRRQFREDLRATAAGGFAAGPAGPNDGFAGGTNGASGSPGAALDYSSLSPLQQIALGLRTARGGAAPTGAGAQSGRAPRPNGTKPARSAAPAPEDASAEPVFHGAD